MGLKRQDVEVLDPGGPIQVVASGPLAQRPAQQPTCIPARAVRVPREKRPLCLCREFRQADQVWLPMLSSDRSLPGSHAPRMPPLYPAGRARSGQPAQVLAFRQ
jgi:hypothetical protein